jgi:type II secretory pathway pseudopilin PulG
MNVLMMVDDTLCGSTRSQDQRGISLVEVLLAMALMGLAFTSSLQSYVRLQATHDLVRQKGEALRWAVAEMENLRGSAFRRNPQGGSAWNDLVSNDQMTLSPFTDPPALPTGWRLDRQVQTQGSAVPGPIKGIPLKSIHLALSWSDRHGKAQVVSLDTLLAGQDPSNTDPSSRLALPIQPWP